ncbi:MAG: dihydropteroate synthase [Pseudomonadota bacterium]
MGILNATPDSFSDGGKFLGYDNAVAQGLKLVEDGADILDIGGESSRPFAQPVSAQEEMDRVVPVIEHLARIIGVPISIDTTKAGVAREAIRAGAAIINDISALEKDPDMARLAAEKKVPVILMHMKGTPETMQIKPSYTDLMAEITTYLSLRAEAAIQAGIPRDRIILDPGIGFGKTVEHNLTLIRRLNILSGLGYPVLMGPSRKSFIQKILSQAAGSAVKAHSMEAGLGTQGAVAACVMNGAHIVRVHDVASVRPLVQVINAVQTV